MDINSLLNPPSSGTYHRHVLLSPSLSDSLVENTTETPKRSATTQKRNKMAKDAAIFTKGAFRGEINFPPHETNIDKNLAMEHRKFRVTPIGDIAQYNRHIPYNSEKKNFMEKTGRDAFDVFQYTFHVPDDPKEKVVMWDYTIGLVKITPFFKSLGYSKTIPNKVLNANQGLREISYSITGGALVAQGYWMPFECAKAVCATFCFDIRHALTPIFGASFVDECLEPTNPSFARWEINPEITRQCADETKTWPARYNGAVGTEASARECSVASDSPGPNPAMQRGMRAETSRRTCPSVDVEVSPRSTPFSAHVGSPTPAMPRLIRPKVPTAVLVDRTTKPLLDGNGLCSEMFKQSPQAIHDRYNGEWTAINHDPVVTPAHSHDKSVSPWLQSFQGLPRDPLMPTPSATPQKRTFEEYSQKEGFAAMDGRRHISPTREEIGWALMQCRYGKDAAEGMRHEQKRRTNSA